MCVFALSFFETNQVSIKVTRIKIDELIYMMDIWRNLLWINMKIIFTSKN